tara:strand:+ start:302 stop:502 length:201 start_codon:yes stop_codon:yes gene_type:complete
LGYKILSFLLNKNKKVEIKYLKSEKRKKKDISNKNNVLGFFKKDEYKKRKIYKIDGSTFSSYVAYL